MSNTQRLTTKISAEGRITLPKAIRQRRQWLAGTQLVVEETTEGVLLKPVVGVPRTKPKNVWLASLLRQAEDDKGDECRHPRGGEAAA